VLHRWSIGKEVGSRKLEEEEDRCLILEVSD